MFFGPFSFAFMFSVINLQYLFYEVAKFVDGNKESFRIALVFFC